MDIVYKWLLSAESYEHRAVQVSFAPAQIGTVSCAQRKCVLVETSSLLYMNMFSPFLIVCVVACDG